VNDGREMRRLLDLGVDGLMTDRPTALRAVLQARGEWRGTRGGELGPVGSGSMNEQTA
jgi:hypothetical protein